MVKSFQKQEALQKQETQPSRQRAETSLSRTCSPSLSSDFWQSSTQDEQAGLVQEQRVSGLRVVQLAEWSVAVVQLEKS